MTSSPQSSTLPGFSPEARLILLCAGGKKGDALFSALEECLNGPFDWDRLLRLSRFHQQHAALFHRLSTHFRDRIPPDTLPILRQEFVSNQWHNLNLIKALHQILCRFSEQSIPCISFKGPLWAQSLYENIALRWIADLDLMIRQEDIPKAKELLLKLGYNPDPVMDPETEKAHIETHWEYGFRHSSQPVRVELHWRFMPTHSAIYDSWSNDLWNRTVAVSLGQNQFQTLSPEDSFLYMVLHGGEKHQWAYMRFLTDFVRVAGGAWSLDWDLLTTRVREIHAIPALSVAFHLCETLFGIETPSEIKQIFPAKPEIQARTALIRGRLFRDSFSLPGYREWLQYIRYHDTLVLSKTERISNWSAPWHYLKAITQPEFEDRACLNDSLSQISVFPYLARVFRLYNRHHTRLLERLR
jgi:hypothetical protein